MLGPRAVIFQGIVAKHKNAGLGKAVRQRQAVLGFKVVTGIRIFYFVIALQRRYKIAHDRLSALMQ